MPCADELVAGIARSRLITFERSGHAPFVEEPVAFTREVATFLRQSGMCHDARDHGNER
jgi:proline iminopeptidase